VPRSPFTQADTPQPWLLGALLPVTLAWLGLATAVIIAAALIVELNGRHEVRRHLQALHTYLPEPTAWERSARLVTYNSACYSHGRVASCTASA
jgi:hypothetical protein